MEKDEPVPSSVKLVSEALFPFSMHFFLFLSDRYSLCPSCLLVRDVTDHTFPDSLFIDESLKFSKPSILRSDEMKSFDHYADLRRHLIT